LMAVINEHDTATFLICITSGLKTASIERSIKLSEGRSGRSKTPNLSIRKYTLYSKSLLKLEDEISGVVAVALYGDVMDSFTSRGSPKEAFVFATSDPGSSAINFDFGNEKSGPGVPPGPFVWARHTVTDINNPMQSLLRIPPSTEFNSQSERHA